jgi:hypothetical protein
MPAIAVFSVFEPDVLQRIGTGADLRRIYDDPVFTLAATPTQAALAAFAAHRTAMLVRELGFDRRTALWALAFFGIGSPAFVYAGADFAQPLTAACVVYSIERGHHYRATDSRAALIGCAISIGYAVLTRPLEASLLLPFAAVACIGYPDRKIRLSEVSSICIALGSVFALAVGLTLMVNTLRYGAPFHNEYASLGARFVVPTTGVLGLLASPARGLAWTFPAIWLVPLGLRHLWRLEDRRSGAVALGGFSFLLLLVTGSWHSWFGGACWGPRFMVSALPLLAVAAAIGAAALDERKRRISSWTLLLLGIGCAAPGVLTDLFAGYGAKIASTEGSFALIHYPPISGWQFTSHVFAKSLVDRQAIDIVWFRAVGQTGWLSLIPFFGLLCGSSGLVLRVRASLRNG